MKSMINVVKELDDIDRQIVKLAGEGKTNKEIAYELNKKPKTIEARKRVMFDYFKVKSTAELVLKISKLVE
jgi:DNA-binding NarL/FixJ family response regulator